MLLTSSISLLGFFNHTYTNKTKSFCRLFLTLYITKINSYLFLSFTKSCPTGPSFNILEPSAKQCQRLWLEQPILSLDDMEVIKNTTFKDWKVWCIHIKHFLITLILYFNKMFSNFLTH